jgi:MFS family permease
MTGFGNGLAFPMTVLIVQRYTSDRVRGRAFTVIISIHNSLLGLAMVASGGLTELAGARWTFGIAAGCVACSTLTIFLLSRRAEPRMAFAGEPAA